MDPQQFLAFRAVLQSIYDECARSPVATMMENHLKVVVLETLLPMGYGFLEGSARTGVGKLLRLHDGVVNVELCSRPTMNAGPESECAKNSPDIRIWDPCHLIIELQTRSCYGTQDTLFSRNIADDLSRVRRGDAGAFILACDRPIYDALRGIKNDNRGRKALHTDVFERLLPDSDSLTDCFPDLPVCSYDGCYMVLAAKTPPTFGMQRVVIGVGSQPVT